VTVILPSGYFNWQISVLMKKLDFEDGSCLEYFNYFLDQLHRTSHKDPFRKLIIKYQRLFETHQTTRLNETLPIIFRIVNQITSENNEDLIEQSTCKLLALLKSESLAIGHKLFVMNIYLDNLHHFGICLGDFCKRL
jgi:hypothetical protein